jgi:hypothetical protein
MLPALTTDVLGHGLQHVLHCGDDVDGLAISPELDCPCRWCRTGVPRWRCWTRCGPGPRFDPRRVPRAEPVRQALVSRHAGLASERANVRRAGFHRHPLQVRVKNRRVNVKARAGYFKS